MKLLIVTQVVDTRHPILGFFHGWIESFAKEVESVEVLCLEKGEYHFPANVTVHSLGKEVQTQSTLVYVWRYVSLLWKLRKQYDAVYAHMNPEYVIAGFPIWFVLRKQIGMWYAHGTVSLRLRIATMMSQIIFTSTPHGFRLTTPKCKVVGQGIDTNLFSPVSEKTFDGTYHLVTVGRITASKNLDTLLRCCNQLKEQGIPFRFSIVGGSITKGEKAYEALLRKQVEELGLTENVIFVGAVQQAELPKTLHKADIFIHDGRTGSLDKALLEAMSAGVPVFSSNDAYIGIVSKEGFDPTYPAGDFMALASVVTGYIALPQDQQEKIIERNRKLIVEEHSLATFVRKIVSQYTITT